MALGRDVEVYVLTVQEGLQRLGAIQMLIDDKAENGPLIRGTRIEAYRIAALLEGGATVERVLKDYPSLTRPQVEAARDFAVAHPKPGRPFPSRSVKQAFEEARLDDLADILDARDTARRKRRG